jgi:hypothetical protein
MLPRLKPPSEMEFPCGGGRSASAARVPCRSLSVISNNAFGIVSAGLLNFGGVLTVHSTSNRRGLSRAAFAPEVAPNNSDRAELGIRGARKAI